jgi:hypothetical protein
MVSLFDPSIELPPLLLVPALAFDLAAWLRRDDLVAIWRVWPRWPARRLLKRLERPVRPLRAAFAGAVFGVVLALVEPGFMPAAVGLTGPVSALVAWCAFSAKGRGSLLPAPPTARRQ